MKKIRLRPEQLVGGERFSSLSILRLVATNSPGRAIGVEEMRKRVRILDAIDKLGKEAEFLLLEDADAETLQQAMEGFPWSSANKTLLNIIDDVLKAEQATARLATNAE